MSEEKTHPSFGMIGVHRIGGNYESPMFGSPLSRHGSIVELTIHEGYTQFDYGESRCREGKRIISVRMTAAQFSELITKWNTHPGTPCTIQWRQDIGGIEQPEPEDVRTEIDMHMNDYNKNIEDTLDQVFKSLDDFEGMLNDGKTWGKKRKKEARLKVNIIRNHLESNLEFIGKQFIRAAGRVVEASKKEIDAFLDRTIRNAGVKALEGQKDGFIVSHNTTEPRGIETDYHLDDKQDL